jgi:hypothetical protein
MDSELSSGSTAVVRFFAIEGVKRTLDPKELRAQKAGLKVRRRIEGIFLVHSEAGWIGAD